MNIEVIRRHIKVTLTEIDKYLIAYFEACGFSKRKAMRKTRHIMRKAIASYQKDFNFMLGWREEIHKKRG